jgi:ankyrin repeat protein
VDAQTGRSLTAVTWPEAALLMSPSEVTEMAMQYGVDSVDRRGKTAMLVAAQAGRLDVVSALIDLGADVDIQDRTCLNPFLWGCIAGDLELVRLMISAGADIERTTRFGGVGITPAAEKGHVEVVRELIETTDINVNHTNTVGWTPLLEAILLRDGGSAQQEIVRLLLDAGADAGMVDKYGVTPLEHAERLGFAAIADLLRSAG